MSKKFLNIKLNNEDFIFDTQEVKSSSFVSIAKIGHYADIWEAYGRPSRIKISIWEDWCEWFESNRGECWISSRNSSLFTITGYVFDERDNMYFCTITKSYHYCWRVEG